MLDFTVRSKLNTEAKFLEAAQLLWMRMLTWEGGMAMMSADATEG